MPARMTPGKRKAGKGDEIDNERRIKPKTSAFTPSTIRKFFTSRSQDEKSAPSSTKSDRNATTPDPILHDSNTIPNVVSVQAKITRFEENISKIAKPTQSNFKERKIATQTQEKIEAKFKLKQRVGCRKPIPLKNAEKSSAKPPPNSAQLNSIRQYFTATQPTPTEATADELPPNKLKITLPPPTQRKSPRIKKLSGRFETQDQEPT